MQKKFFSLLFFFVTSHIPNAIAINGSSSVLLVNNENETETEADTYVPPVENYHTLMVEPVKVDYLYNLGSQQSAFAQKVKKIDWRGLFRANAAFLYAIRINRSRFAVCLGGGVNTLYYAFDGQNRGGENVYPTLRRDSESRTECRDLDNKTGKKYTYSAFEIPFFDVLLRLRFNSILSEPKAGYHGWLGLKFGIRRSASVILHYEEYHDTGASTVHKGNFNLKPYAFALQAGMGYHRFGLAFGWYLIPLFNQNQGPSYTDKLRPFSFSIYADLV